MSCDVHGFVEVKVKGKWQAYSAIKTLRDYTLFARMAGVRGDEDPIAEPRGFPEDAAMITRLEYEWWGSDAHTPSYLTAKEVALIENEAAKIDPALCRNYLLSVAPFGYVCGNSIRNISKYPEDCPKWIDDVRLVFWFDN